ncbi:hypothetical protein [Streptomyces sp. NPDC001594]|uniref:hypothetical protein n=1 Tax=Streptomyces sp. NPDC001594 TaxID=3364590 RepID=UPI00368DFFA7
MSQPRRFHLLRHTDISGVSGTGIVADGILWPDGTASLRWRGERPSTVHWDRIADTQAVHGHKGATEIVWDEPEQASGRAAAFREAVAVAQDEAIRLEFAAGVEAARGARCVAYLLRRMAEGQDGTADRLARIADAHHHGQVGGGMTSGLCTECELTWPCPTYMWATTRRDPLATWDPADDEVGEAGA